MPARRNPCRGRWPRYARGVEFLVTITVVRPSDVDDDAFALLRQAELARGLELLDSGAIEAIWRVPDAHRLRNVGVWRADDEGALRTCLSTLPLHRFMTIEVTPLSAHPLTEHAEERAARADR